MFILTGNVTNCYRSQTSRLMPWFNLTLCSC